MREEITESWRDKDYEEFLTIKLDKASSMLRMATAIPTIENARVGYSAVKEFLSFLIKNSKQIEASGRTLKPQLELICLALYGRYNSIESREAQSELGIIVNYNRRTKKMIVEDMPNLLNRLWEILEISIKWGYEGGFFAKKPYDRKYGKPALQDTFNM